MGKIRRTVHASHDKGRLLGGLLHYVAAASNHTSKGYRRDARGKDLYRMAAHRTGIYQTRFAEYIVRDVLGSHKAWRTNRLAEPHARAPHYHNGVAQTDRFELAFGETSKRWNGEPAVHVAIYGRGRQDRPRMAFKVPPYVVEKLGQPGVVPKSVRLSRDEIFIIYEVVVPDREPETWAGMDINAKNNTYAYPNGMTGTVWNEYGKEYSRAHSKIQRVRRLGDARVMEKCMKKAWKTYQNRIKDHVGKEARACARAGCAVGFEDLKTHRLYTKDRKMSPYARGKMKSTLNAGQRRRAITNALESEGLPHAGVDPAGTSSNCLECGQRLKRSAVRQEGVRNLWCQPCRAIRERDGNAGANILFRTILALVMEWTGHDGSQRKITLPGIISTLREAVSHRGMTAPQRSTLSDIMRTLEGRSAGAEWRLPGAHKPGRRNPAGGEPVGGPGVGGFGRNGPGPPNAAKLCVGDYA